MKTIILVGIPGSGKSSVLQEVIRQVPHVRVVNYGDKMLEEATREGITRDTLRKMPLAEQQKIGVQAAKKIAQHSGPITIVDTHGLIRTPIGFCPGLPRPVLEILMPYACAWVECNPQVILQRRNQDTNRQRDQETVEELNIHQELTRLFLTACSMHSGSLLCRIDNTSSALTQNAQPLIRLIQSI